LLGSGSAAPRSPEGFVSATAGVGCSGSAAGAGCGAGAADGGFETALDFAGRVGGAFGGTG
jgi:hypothetical protein